MDVVVGWLQKLKTRKRPEKEGRREATGTGAIRPPPDRISVALVIGSLAMICMTITVLLIWDIRSEKDFTREQDTGELNAQNIQKRSPGVQAEPLRRDDAPKKVTVHWISSSPTHPPVIRGLPGSPYQTLLTKNPAPARFDAGVDSRERGIRRQPSAVAQRLASVPDSKKEQLKALKTYLRRYRAYLRNVRRHSKTALSYKRNRDRGPGSFFAAIGHAFGF